LMHLMMHSYMACKFDNDVFKKTVLGQFSIANGLIDEVRPKNQQLPDIRPDDLLYRALQEYLDSEDVNFLASYLAAVAYMGGYYEEIFGIFVQENIASPV